MLKKDTGRECGCSCNLSLFCCDQTLWARIFFPKVGSGLGSLVRLAQAAWSPGPLLWSPSPWSSGLLVLWSLVLRVPNPLRSLFQRCRGPQAAARDNLGAGLADVQNRNWQMRGPGLRYMMNRNRHMRDEPGSPNEGACLRYRSRAIW